MSVCYHSHYLYVGNQDYTPIHPLNLLNSPVKIFCDHNVITNHGRDHRRDTLFTVITPSAMRDWSDHTRDQGVITPLTVILYSDGVITYG